IRATKNDAQRPLFSQEKPQEEAKPDESWREVGIETLELGTRITKALTEAELLTIGSMADYSSSGKQLTDIAGIGPAAAETIDERMQQFWSERNLENVPLAEVSDDEFEDDEDADEDRFDDED